MIDILWSEILIILVVALIFLGPSEMLVLIKTLGRLMAKAQAMFQNLKMAIDYEVHKQETKETSYEKEIKDSKPLDSVKNVDDSQEVNKE
ncbi:MAG: twin-arginine translocase subunit TatB [Proteobacteria bacterium]|nr:twin-arginine translocase subunit TatB [Pseudomonadota bacterium]